MEKPRVLLLGAGGPAAIGVARSLRPYCDLTGMDENEFALNFAEVDKKVLFNPEKATPNEKHTFCSGFDFVHAQPDPEVLWLSENREGLNTFLPSRASVIICQDKFKTHMMLKDLSPYTMALTHKENLWNAFRDTGFEGKMWVRDRKGAAGKDSILANREDAEIWVNQHKGWGRFIASEYLPGRCRTVQQLWKNGRLIMEQGRERLSWYLGNRAPSGVTGVTGVARTCNDADIYQVATQAVRSIDPEPNGIWGIDMKNDANGIPKVTEINIGRFFTTIEFFTQAGMNFPWEYVRAALDYSDWSEWRYMDNKLPENLHWLRSMDAKPILANFVEQKQKGV